MRRRKAKKIEWIGGQPRHRNEGSEQTQQRTDPATYFTVNSCGMEIVI